MKKQWQESDMSFRQLKIAGFDPHALRGEWRVVPLQSAEIVRRDGIEWLIGKILFLCQDAIIQSGGMCAIFP